MRSMTGLFGVTERPRGPLVATLPASETNLGAPALQEVSCTAYKGQNFLNGAIIQRHHDVHGAIGTSNVVAHVWASVPGSRSTPPLCDLPCALYNIGRLIQFDMLQRLREVPYDLVIRF